MPGGVMLQIGIHYTDVLEYLIGPIHAVRGQSAQLVLPGDNPDVASLILQHENGALSTLNASYASASEYYLMNVYGKDATAYYDLHNGLRFLKRGENEPVTVQCAKNDTLVEELEEFAAAARGQGQHEVGGEYATRSLAVVRAGILSAREGRRVEVAEILDGDEVLSARPRRTRGREYVMKPRIRVCVWPSIVIAMAFVAGIVPARAQDYPSRSITVIVPFPAGGASDVVARIVTNQMSRLSGNPSLSRMSAAPAARWAARAWRPPHPTATRCLQRPWARMWRPRCSRRTSSTIPLTDFVPIGITAHSPAVVIARKDFPAQT